VKLGNIQLILILDVKLGTGCETGEHSTNSYSGCETANIQKDVFISKTDARAFSPREVISGLITETSFHIKSSLRLVASDKWSKTEILVRQPSQPEHCNSKSIRHEKYLHLSLKLL